VPLSLSRQPLVEVDDLGVDRLDAPLLLALPPAEH
jgi:hypothetical protein